jgi:hypothetical protein
MNIACTTVSGEVTEICERGQFNLEVLIFHHCRHRKQVPYYNRTLFGYCMNRSISATKVGKEGGTLLDIFFPTIAARCTLFVLDWGAGDSTHVSDLTVIKLQ